jgi:ubiquinone/menaquinone biosynthesis C-methylase UbiE
MSDWRTYDAIADGYERRCATRFQEGARRLLAFASADPPGRMLDLGTGTGAVLSALGGAAGAIRLVVGCDRSMPMLTTARNRVASAHFVASDVARLPFRPATFDLVTANCVLSHLPSHKETLGDARRVLRRRGSIAISSWGRASDPCSAAWNDLLAEAIGADAARSALEEVVPMEAFLADPGNVRTALVEGGFRSVRVAITDLGYTGSVEDYVAERGLGAAARFGRHALGEARWGGFLEHAEADLRRRFGARITYERPFVLACGTAP